MRPCTASRTLLGPIRGRKDSVPFLLVAPYLEGDLLGLEPKGTAQSRSCETTTREAFAQGQTRLPLGLESVGTEHHVYEEHQTALCAPPI